MDIVIKFTGLGAPPFSWFTTIFVLKCQNMFLPISVQNTAYTFGFFVAIFCCSSTIPCLVTRALYDSLSYGVEHLRWQNIHTIYLSAKTEASLVL